MTSKQTCDEYQVNRRVPDFSCDLKKGHTEPHHDPRTQQRWRPRGHRPFRGRKT